MPLQTEAVAASRPRSRAADEARTTLTPQHWVAEATAVLVDSGIDTVRVDVLAKRLGVTRGSFYWHFKDRDDLLSHVLDAWRNAATEQLIQRFEHRTSDPHELLKELISLPFRGRSAQQAARIELAIRGWARRDATARQAVDDVDARRISYIAQCFSALGFDIAEARHRGFLLYAYEVAESMLSNQGTTAQKTQRSTLMERLLLTRGV